MASLNLARLPFAGWAMLLSLAVAGAVLACAWISDDALVTFRTVENLAAGHGWRWNVLDRVQTATHPLWVLLLVAARLLTGELYYTAIWLSVGLVGLAVLLLALPQRRSPAGLLLLAVALLGSRAFVDFGTGGLENPLVALLLALFVGSWFRGAAGLPALRPLALLAACLLLARMDLIWLVLPCLLASAVAQGPRLALRAAWPALGLLVVWSGFAFVYFGSVLPTPALGKVLAADVPLRDIWQQGGYYLADLLRRDPVTAVVLLLGIAGILRGPALRWPALGILLQLLYTVHVGGDFMAGRFFTPSFVVAVAVMLHQPRGRAQVFAGFALVAALLTGGLPTWCQRTPTQAGFAIYHGIGNERAYYAEQLGLWSAKRPPFRYGMLGQAVADRPRPPVLLAHAAGVPGYLYGPHAHLVDPYLCDPLLMRLPLRDPARWRIGHFQRRIPEGYLETLARGDNRIHHPGLRRYWATLAKVLREPLWSWSRWQALWQLHGAEHAGLLRDFLASEYQQPPCIEVSAADLPADLPPVLHWSDAEAVLVREGGLCVRGLPLAARLRLCFAGQGSGELRWLRGDATVAVQSFDETGAGPASRWREFALPPGGADALVIRLPQLPVAPGELPLVLEEFALLGLAIAD